MKAVFLIAFLLFCLAIAGGYYYHNNVYVKKQEAAAAEAERAEKERLARQEQIKAELEAAAKARAARAEAETKAKAAKSETPDGGKVNIPPAQAPRPVTRPVALPKESASNPADAAREKELSEMRKTLRAAQQQANGEKK